MGPDSMKHVTVGLLGKESVDVSSRWSMCMDTPMSKGVFAWRIIE